MSGYTTKIQLIKRAKSEQLYINFPAALAKAMDFKKGDKVLWKVRDDSTLVITKKGIEIPIDDLLTEID